VFQEPVVPSTAAARLPALPRTSFAAIVAKATAAAAAGNTAVSGGATDTASNRASPAASPSAPEVHRASPANAENV